ncbi:hypothetical protein [Sediminibacterium soli]|uniref:hypothetical protein n=1 Tax=Sediminibacterium soli TaxID=2698829 RepID=UPI00137A68DF|nr:hypothetical protein [Sediminibacterium soli]NCI46391.1 hypothetical protein [Sediminibacterium soli]
MRLSFTIFSLLLLAGTADAQKITGIWRGYFTSSPIIKDGLGEERYKYEVQIEQKSNNGIAGVTYSYKTTVFYGKAELTGILTLPAKTLILRETKLVDLKIGDKSEPCLMTCYLDYTRIGKLEVLEGTFISTNMKDKRDCGSGKVYLEKVTESDFQKEDFLVKKTDKPAANNKTAQATNKPPAQKTPPQAGTRTGMAKLAPKPPAASPKVSTNAGNAKGNVAPNSRQPEKTIEQPAIVTVPKTPSPGITQQTENIPKKFPTPKALIERENNLVKTINVYDPYVTVELYDNGTIDNDTVTVYHNNQLAISKARLSYSPLSVKLHCSEEDARHEFVMVAENLGEFPPNTAIMVIKVGKDRFVARHEITLSANEQRNAKVIINYIPKQ